MSWSVSGSGKVSDVQKSIGEQFANITYLKEPENSIKVKVDEIVAAALAAFPPDRSVSITANGSQSLNPDTGHATNSLYIRLEPIV